MPRRSATAPLPELLYRTTPRDRYLAAMLYEHRALTATQITTLAFPSLRAANQRLATLAGLGVVDRTRVRTSLHAATGYLYTLGPAGAVLAAAPHGLSAKELRYDRAVLQRQAARPDLPHTLGCNTVMIRLATRHRTDPALRLTTWWGPISCLRLWGDIIRPDAYAVTTTADGREDGWFLEYDTGTESVTQLAAKLRAYRRFSQTYAGHRPILIHLPTPVREARLHQVIAETYPGPCPAPVATSTDPDLAAHTWRIAGHPLAPDGTPARFPLASLPTALATGGYRILPAQTSDPEIYAPDPVPNC
jgi:hypothetical protein